MSCKAWGTNSGERVYFGDPRCSGIGRVSAIDPGLEKHDGGGVIVREPNREETDPDSRERLIVEFYSR
jgi:hypothetical protein